MVKRSRGKARSKSKKVMGWNEFSVLRALVGLAIVIYIVGIVPSYTQAVGDLFKEPLVKLVFLGLILAVGYMDKTLGVLLTVAFLVSLFTSARYSSTPLGRVVSEARSGAQQVVRVPQHLAQKAENVVTDAVDMVTPDSLHENMGNGNSVQTVQQAFEASERAGQELYGKGTNCTVMEPSATGCDPIVGYNAPYDCVCDENCSSECDKKNRGCLCDGVATWTDELNAQGLNYPMGNPGPQEGATY